MKKQNGFTLLEITVVVAIIALLSTIFLANYRGGDKQYALLRASHKLAQDIRTIEEMALSSRKTPGEIFGGTFPRGGYGIYVTNDPSGDYQCPTAPLSEGGYCIILFADCDEGQDYDFQGSAENCSVASSVNEGDSVNEKIKDLILETGVKIINISPSSPLTITFSPPDPTVVINKNPNIDSAFIELGYEGQTGGKKIEINRLGQIEITSY
jgi:prepilin-type N-terminal cleavage/methylation domain-containing protein